MNATRSISKAGRRLTIAAALLALVAGFYYYADTMDVAYRDLNGYIPLLPIVRLGLAIVAAGLFFGIAYLLRVIIVRGVQALAERSKTERKRDLAQDTRVERSVDLVLSMAALALAHALVKPALAKTLVPLSGVGWVPPAFGWVCLAAGVVLLACLVLQIRSLVVGRSRAARPASGAQAPAIAGWATATDGSATATAGSATATDGRLQAPASADLYCAECGSPFPEGAGFCGTCGAARGESGV